MQPEDALAVVGRRREYLRLLDAEPAYKRDIVQAVDGSRSTVDRAVAELSENGLIGRVEDGQYAITAKGRLFLDTYLETTDILETGEKAAPLLAHLPDDVVLPPGFFVDASVSIATGPDPTEEISQVMEVLAETESVKAFGRADHVPEVIQLLYERTVVEEVMDLTAVINTEMAAWMEAEYASMIDPIEASDRVEIAVLDSLPFGMYLLETGDRQSVFLIIHDENLIYQGFVRTRSPWAVEWAEGAFEEHWNRAEPRY